jgi:thiol-disulfide isomerase/thioredoxin
MRIPGVIAMTLVATISLQAAPQVGDTYEKVRAEKGPPSGAAEAGSIQILRYPDQTITFRQGHVVTIEKTVVSVSWTSNHAAALERAKTENRHVLLFFTGSDWCPWCERIKAEIFSTAEFRRYADEHLVLVELDFPRQKQLPRALIDQNSRLQQEYRITGYPAVIVLDSSGRRVGELGYQPDGPKPFLDALGKM